MSSGRNGSLTHETIVTDTNGSSMVDEPLLWTEALSSAVVRDLVGYAQRHGFDDWMSATELARRADVSERTIYNHLDTVVILGAYEKQRDGRQTLYRPLDESYINTVMRGVEDHVRTQMSSDNHE